MESGLPMLNCVLQHTLRSLCFTSSDTSSTSSKWVYAVFWKILPRNYPPPKWDYGGGALDYSKTNKRNWILVWEDGFCDFYECKKATKGRNFGADVFFKMSHEVYSYGEGLVGNVAADDSYKWVFRDNFVEKDPNLLISWNISVDSQPKAWEIQFQSGIQTIAVISVREGLIQLASFEKIDEDLNLVISTRRKFSYLLSLPSFYAIQRPFLNLPIQNPFTYNKELSFGLREKARLSGLKRVYDELFNEFPLKSLDKGPLFWPIPPLFHSTPYNFDATSAKAISEDVNDFDAKTKPFCVIRDEEKEEENKCKNLIHEIRI